MTNKYAAGCCLDMLKEKWAALERLTLSLDPTAPGKYRAERYISAG